MKMFITKVVLLAAGVAIIILSVGCQEEKLPSEKKSRIIAAENIQLKKELKQRDQEIEKLKKQHEKQVQQQQELLAEYKKQKEALEKQLQQNVKEQIEEVLANVIEENAKLREEIKKLKTQER
jgi:septal ring factor EnvC (AmiA/AmiB activator)